MKSRISLFRHIFLVLGAVSVAACTGRTDPPGATGAVEAESVERNRVLYVDSYNPEYEWVRDIMDGLFSKLRISSNPDGTFDDGRSPVDLEVVHLDTKRHPDDEWGMKAGLSAKRFIDAWNPDIVLTSDDNAIRYLVIPYLSDPEIPLIFSGINWDISVLEFKRPNSTGMIQVFPIKKVKDILTPYSRGGRVGLIAEKSETEEKNVPYLVSILGKSPEIRFVRTAGEFKARFLELQERCDMILISVFQNIESLDADDMRTFLLENTRVPTGSVYDFLAPYALVSCAVLGEEQGEWMAQTALRILSGVPASSIPVGTNKRMKIYLNMELAKNLGIVFPMDLIEQATFVEEVLDKTGGEVL